MLKLLHQLQSRQEVFLYLSPLSNFLFDVVKIVNSYSSVTISLDVPTGINASDGGCDGQAIMADYTMAVGLPKIGLYVSDGVTHSGEIFT